MWTIRNEADKTVVRTVFVFACVILFPDVFKSFFMADMTFLLIFLKVWQLSFGLSIKSTHEIEWSKVN